ncbi:MAG TPA: FAD-dependent oxidoreductase [Devosia sp.]|uniref:dihydrolipoyl dehydrogenase family protein n=1 Tax=Devosia sp. TaxID=1871048 RepID=UPI002DDCB29D|nr:FAD-dependent oxidoreductase [Devosia sp.]HEV2516091.1 FAD-dependent oxidoreductase [Devosia sp.]
MADILTPDLCVIGAGSGGLAVAEAARAYGASVVLVEKARMGGNALNAGAIPAKALVAAAAHAQAMRDGAAFGIAADEPKINFRKVHDHVEQVIAALAPRDAAGRLAAQGVDIVRGAAHFINRKALSVGDTEIRARRFVIATGARLPVPSIPGLDAVPYFTSETILDNTRKLTHLVVIGGGPVAIELAQAYARLGTEVTVVENGPLLAGFDPELADIALKRLAEEGVSLRPHATVTAIQARSMGIGVAVQSGEADQLLDASHILVAAERLPNLTGLDLDKAGIRMSKADPRLLQLTAGLRTTNPRVYAVGDAAGGQSVQAAVRQADTVVRSVLLGAMAKPDALRVPRVVSTDPELAEIGLNEALARSRHGIGFRVTRWSYADNDRARAARATYGLAKLLTDRSGWIIGAGVVGPGAGELVSLFSLAMTGQLRADKLAELVAPYPSYAEIAVRLGEAFRRGETTKPLIRQWIGLNKLLG